MQRFLNKNSHVFLITISIFLMYLVKFVWTCVSGSGLSFVQTRNIIMACIYFIFWSFFYSGKACWFVRSPSIGCLRHYKAVLTGRARLDAQNTKLWCVRQLRIIWGRENALVYAETENLAINHAPAHASHQWAGNLKDLNCFRLEKNQPYLSARNHNS